MHIGIVGFAKIRHGDIGIVSDIFSREKILVCDIA
jgi:hypothetical protein